MCHYICLSRRPLLQLPLISIFSNGLWKKQALYMKVMFNVTTYPNPQCVCLICDFFYVNREHRLRNLSIHKFTVFVELNDHISIIMKTSHPFGEFHWNLSLKYRLVT